MIGRRALHVVTDFDFDHHDAMWTAVLTMRSLPAFKFDQIQVFYQQRHRGELRDGPWLLGDPELEATFLELYAAALAERRARSGTMADDAGDRSRRK